MDPDALPMSPVSRREFVGAAGLAAAGMAAPLDRAVAQSHAVQPPSGPPDQVARDETFWQRVAACYRISPAVTNLENGYWGVMAQPVLDAYKSQIDRVNAEGVYYVRNAYVRDLDAARTRVAAALGADVAEVAFTRGATEAMQVLIGGYNRLKAGDAVMYADLDYPGMQYAMNWLASRRGVRVTRFVIPEPATTQNVLDAYATALDANADVRMMLVTHCSHKTGFIFPVTEIVALARSRDVDVLVDAAHSWGQIEFSVGTLGADFVGFTLQKWIAGPVGLGAVYIRKDRLAAIDPMMGDEDFPADDVRSRVHSGTVNFAAALTAPAALDFHDRVGAANKAARLRYLRDRWVDAVRGVRGVQILTPDDRAAVGGITSFRLNGGTSSDHNQRLIETLRDRYGLFTARRTGVARGDCVRVTPAIYNSVADVDRLATAIKELARA
jgi:selenocysteine lyase/cysteine desulfurase